MKKVKKLVFATNNAHKLQEARQIIKDGFEIVSLAEIGCHDDIPETADTLEGNALIKARWVKERYGYDCFADDTGLMVDSLGGAPGVYSARYAGEHCSPADNVRKLLGELEGVADRKARFATVVALSLDGAEHCFEGSVEGRIATEPHGAGGFGYDPVFIAEESGRCFAEMAPGDKNAISHRGRAMRKLRDFLGSLCVLIAILLVPLAVRADQWRLHSSYDGQMERIVDTPKFTYFLGTAQTYRTSNKVLSTLFGTLMRYDKEGDEFMTLNSQNLLSGNIVRAVGYNYDKKYLVVCYDDGNIDFLYDNGDKVNIPGLRLADSSLDKTVYDITFHNASNSVYLATGFGYVLLDDGNCEVRTSRVFNKVVDSAARFGDKLLLSVDGRLLSGDVNSFSLEDFSQLGGVQSVKRFVPLNDNKMIAYAGSQGSMKCYYITYNGGSYAVSPLSSEAETGVEPMASGVIVSGPRSLRIISKDGSERKVTLPSDDAGSLAGSLDGRDVWLSAGRKGISQKRLPAEGGGSWTMLKDRFFPNVSTAFMCTGMGYSPSFGMLVRNHGIDLNFNGGTYADTPDLISGYKDMTWTPLSATYRCDMPGLVIDGPGQLALDPNNPDHVYCGTVMNGILRLDLRNPEKSLHLSKKTDSKGGYGKPGFVVVAPDPPSNVAWAAPCSFAPVKFDASGVMWTAHVNPEPREEVSSYTELWYWLPSDRAATTSADSYRPMKQIRIDGIDTGNFPVVLPLRYGQNKNIVLHCGNTVNSSMIVYDHGGSLDNLSDDKYVTLKRLYDQDGTEFDFNYVYSWLEDPLTGLVWVGYGEGVFTFNPRESLSSPGAVRRIKVARNDGSGLADFLLDGVRVNAIASDESGRKWFATNGGGLVCTSSDGREILKTYSPDNSMIPGSVVYAVCHNPDNGSMMVSTDKGLCELFPAGASASGSDSGIRVFPNPVRTDYYGYVTIDGLPDGAMVKIVDTLGNVVRECGQADGGQVLWDLNDMNRSRVAGGIYFIIASAGPDADSYDKIGKILVGG